MKISFIAFVRDVLWRDLPSDFGLWNSIFKKINRWSQQGKWLKIFEAVVQEPDREWLFVDGSYIRAHRHSSGAATADGEATAKSSSLFFNRNILAVSSSEAVTM